MFRFWRTSAAVRAATGAIQPLIGRSRARLGSIPEHVWGEPYMLGLLMTLITLTAQHSARGRLDSEDLGLVQLLAWQRLTGLPDDEAGERLCRLSAEGDDFFEWGCERGGRLYELMHGLAGAEGGSVRRFDLEPDAAETDPAGAWQRYFEDRIADLTSA